MNKLKLIIVFLFITLQNCEKEPLQSDSLILDRKLDLFFKSDSIKSVKQRVIINEQSESESLWVNENILIYINNPHLNPQPSTLLPLFYIVKSNEIAPFYKTEPSKVNFYKFKVYKDYFATEKINFQFVKDTLLTSNIKTKNHSQKFVKQKSNKTEINVTNSYLSRYYGKDVEISLLSSDKETALPAKMRLDQSNKYILMVTSDSNLKINIIAYFPFVFKNRIITPPQFYAILSDGTNEGIYEIKKSNDSLQLFDVNGHSLKYTITASEN